jgi:hypothetical protein
VIGDPAARPCAHRKPTLFEQARDYLTEDGRLLVQFPLWFRPKIERLALAHGFQVKSVRRMPPKSLGLALLSLAYLQVGFRSALYLIEPVAPDRQGELRPEAGSMETSRAA